MQSSNFFLKTKLLPPRSVPEVLHRGRLLDKIKGNQNSPVTMIAADAGCGKTTLISEFIKLQPRPVVWYQLDHTDADPAVFLGYLATGIRTFAPEFGDTFFQYLEGASEEISRFPERPVDLLINEIMNSVEQQFILVLDDYHHIGRETVVHKMVDRLLQYSADLLHVVITTRDLPPLAISRRRTQFRSMLITRDDLSFTDDEVRELFQTTLNLDLDATEVTEYRNRTHGWITALQLIRQVAEREIAAGGSAKPIDLREVLKSSERDIFDYFAEEVVSRESPQTELLCLRLSLLDSMPLELCSRLFPDLHCSSALPELAQKNVFLTVAGDGSGVEEYRFHPLFRDFLRRRYRSEKGHVAVARERVRIADYFRGKGQWDVAVPYLIDAEEFEQAAAVVADRGSEWIASGVFTSLGLTAERIPDDALELHPRSLVHLAEVARLQGEGEKASRLLERSVRLLSVQGDAVGEAEALHSLASLARRKQDLDGAMKLLERSEELAAPGSETSLKCANTRGLCLVGSGNWIDAEQQFRIALELAEKHENDHYIRLVAHNLALAPGFRGDFAEALRWFRKIFGNGKPEKQLPQEAIGHLNVARLHLYRGEFESTESHLEKALELCQLYNLRALRGEIYEAFANFHREKNELERADEYYGRAASAYDDAGIDLTSREFIEERSKNYRLLGDPARARNMLENVIDSRRGQGNELGLRTAELCVCRLDLDEEKTDGLTERIDELCQYFRTHGNHYDETLASMLLAETHFVNGNEKQMVEATQRVLDLSARFDYEFWLRSEIERNPNIFSNIDVFERLPVDLRTIVAAASALRMPIPSAKLVSVKPVEVKIISTFADLTINVLGPVNIFREADKPFAPDAWTTRRARDIFCLISTSKNRRVAKDILIDIFWGAEDPAAVEKNFHPTISHIRKALNSRQSFKQNFVVFRDGAYQLNPELKYAIDTEDFETHIAAAEKAKREKDNELLRASLERAAEIYKGDFLEGSYEDWADERRNYFQEQQIRVISALAKLAYSEKRWAAVNRFSEQILSADPFREDIHRLVLRSLAAQGKPAAVKKHFEHMANTLRSELGIEPSAETRRVFKGMMS